jgi:opacity protein-like surface antigen
MEEKDQLVTVTPELTYLRAAGVLNLEGRAGVEVIRFMDFTDQDADDFFSYLAVSFPNRPGVNPRRILASVGWRQRSDVNEALGTRARSDLFDSRVAFRSALTDRLGVRLTGGYHTERFRQGEFSGIEVGTLGMDGIRVYSDRLETYVGYRYRESETEGRDRSSLDVQDHLLRLGVEGDLSPRVLGQVEVGIQKRSFGDTGQGDSLQPFGMASVSWTPRHGSVFALRGQKDFDVAADDRSVETKGFSVVWRQRVYRGLSIVPALSYENVRLTQGDGRSRTDDRYGAGLGAIYRLASEATVEVQYSYLDRHSNNSFFTYRRHILTASGAIEF